MEGGPGPARGGAGACAPPWRPGLGASHISAPADGKLQGAVAWKPGRAEAEGQEDAGLMPTFLPRGVGRGGDRRCTWGATGLPSSEPGWHQRLGVGMALGVSCTPRGRVVSWTLWPLALQASVPFSGGPGPGRAEGPSHPHVLGACPACDFVIGFLSDLSSQTTGLGAPGSALLVLPPPGLSTSTGSWAAGLVPVNGPRISSALTCSFDGITGE